MVNGISRLNGINFDEQVKKYGANQNQGLNDDNLFADARDSKVRFESADVEREYQEAAAAAGKDDGVDPTGKNDKGDVVVPEADKADKPEETKPTDKTEKTDYSGKSAEELAEKKKELQEEKKENLEKMDKIEDKIEDTAEDAEDAIKQAQALQEAKVEKQQEEADEVVADAVEEFKEDNEEASKNGEEGMTQQDLANNIDGELPANPGMADAKALYRTASEDVYEMDTYLGDLNGLISDTNGIDKELDAIEEGEAAAQAAAEEAAKKQCCDPIGFTMGEGEEQVRYDFIKDDGAFDTTSDFLGSKDNFKEMEALDTDGDKVVTKQELEAGGIKAVKTDAQGNKSTVNLADEFGDDFSIDLNSYKEGGSHSAIDTSTGEQTLSGTFDLNIGGETVSGYNTLDDVNFLESNYGVTNDIETPEAAEEATEGLDASAYSEELQPHVNFFNTYTEKSADFKKEIADGLKDLGLSEQEIEDINKEAKQAGEEKANIFLKSLDPKEAEDEMESEVTEETDDAETADVTAEDKEAAEKVTEMEGEITEGSDDAEIADVTAEDKEAAIKEEQPAFVAKEDAPSNPFANTLSAEEQAEEELKIEEMLAA